MAVRLFVGNLPYDVTEAELRAHFAAIGPLSYLSLATDRDTGKPRGFAFVEFSARADAEEAIRRLNNQAFKGRPLAVNEARPRDAHAPASAPRPPTAADPSTDAGRDFGPDAAPRRRRPQAKRAVHAERGPKRPIYKRAPGPVRFSAGDEDGDEEEVRGAHGARHRTDAAEHDTVERTDSGARVRDEPLKRGTGWRKNHERPFKSVKRNEPASKSSTTKRSGGWRPKRSAGPARRPWQTTR